MIADANFHVWLETNTNTKPSIVIPYVQSSEDKRIHYRLRATKSGRSGTSDVSQSGTVNIQAKRPTALSKMSISANKSDTCQIELTLAESGATVGSYHFDCPRQEE
ncbi:MAG: curli-like amyloid fiber formation chaperone CsgH [Burkholderiaceae bacterium]